MDNIVAHLIKVFTPVIEAMVDFPEAIDFQGQVSPSKTVLLQLRLQKEDTGKVIGREGKHAFALRTLMTAVGAIYKCRVILEILE